MVVVQVQLDAQRGFELRGSDPADPVDRVVTTAAHGVPITGFERRNGGIVSGPKDCRLSIDCRRRRHMDTGVVAVCAPCCFGLSFHLDHLLKLQIERHLSVTREGVEEHRCPIGPRRIAGVASTDNQLSMITRQVPQPWDRTSQNVEDDIGQEPLLLVGLWDEKTLRHKSRLVSRAYCWRRSNNCPTS